VSKKSEGNFNAISKKNEKKLAEKEAKEKEGKK
jgi:hypothetical protein